MKSISCLKQNEEAALYLFKNTTPVDLFEKEATQTMCTYPPTSPSSSIHRKNSKKVFSFLFERGVLQLNLKLLITFRFSTCLQGEELMRIFLKYLHYYCKYLATVFFFFFAGYNLWYYNILEGFLHEALSFL